MRLQIKLYKTGVIPVTGCRQKFAKLSTISVKFSYGKMHIGS